MWIQLYPTDDAPRYIKGHAVTMAMVAFASILYTLMFLYFTRENQKREKGVYDHKIEGMSEEDILALGDENPRFIFSR